MADEYPPWIDDPDQVRKVAQWVNDPDKVLDVALAHCVWDDAFAARLVKRIAEWAQAPENERRRKDLQELLKAPQAGRQPLAAVEYAAALARHKELMEGGKTYSEALVDLAKLLKTSEHNIKTRIEKAQKLLDAGELDDWAVVFRKRSVHKP
jgi:hypothetical protein